MAYGCRYRNNARPLRPSAELPRAEERRDGGGVGSAVGQLWGGWPAKFPGMPGNSPAELAGHTRLTLCWQDDGQVRCAYYSAEEQRRFLLRVVADRHVHRNIKRSLIGICQKSGAKVG
jgi:hypothetical protein